METMLGKRWLAALLVLGVYALLVAFWGEVNVHFSKPFLHHIVWNSGFYFGGMTAAVYALRRLLHKSCDRGGAA